MNIEFETNEKGYCKYFKLNGENAGKGIERAIIIIEACKKPIVIFEGKADKIKADIKNAEVKVKERMENNE